MVATEASASPGLLAESLGDGILGALDEVPLVGFGEAPGRLVVKTQDADLVAGLGESGDELGKAGGGGAGDVEGGRDAELTQAVQDVADPASGAVVESCRDDLDRVDGVAADAVKGEKDSQPGVARPADRGRALR